MQKFTADGRFLLSISGEGERGVSLPWGLACDAQDNVYVADFGNDAVKKYSSGGEFLAAFGSSGRGEGQFTRPASVAVDRDGYIYVADWGNERVQVLDAEGNFVQLLGVRVQSPSGPPTSSASTGRRPPPAPPPTWTWR